MGRRIGPILISVGLVIWLVWHVTPEKLGQAFATGPWPWLILVTVVQLVILFLWDTISLWWLFSQPDQAVPFRMVLRARTDSVLWSAVNLEIGQGVFAWRLAQAGGDSVKGALGRCLAVALFDFGTLQALGLIGSFLKPNALIRFLRWVCVGSVVGLLVLAVIVRYLREDWRRWLVAQERASWLAWWRWRHSLLLGVQRLILFLLMFVYVGVGLAICRIPADVRTVVGRVPFILIAESLPGTGGLGERETALVYLLSSGPDQRAALLSFGLIWSAVTILGRVMMGLLSAWLPRAARSAPRKDESPSRSPPKAGLSRLGPGASEFRLPAS
jgi:hypothetical protein